MDALCIRRAVVGVNAPARTDLANADVTGHVSVSRDRRHAGRERQSG